MSNFKKLTKYIPISFKRLINKSIKELALKKNRGDIEVELKQIMSILKREFDFMPPPPKHLQMRVVGSYSPLFIEKGYEVYNTINDALKQINRDTTDFTNIYDFGCGCGRVIRAFKTQLPTANLFGSDIDSEAIDWLNRNYHQIGAFDANPAIPPAVYDDNFFDFVYSISIFTHLPEDMQYSWLKELSRITKPDAILFLTVHGESAWSQQVGDNLKVMKEKGFLYLKYGQTPGLPEFYDTAYHSVGYINREWSKYFNVLKIIPSGLDNRQDIVLLQNKGSI